MYYEPGRNNHGLPFDPFKSCVVPRPIGWISTTSEDGADNLAPYSQFQNVTFDPPTVMFSANRKFDGTKKDTTLNVLRTGEFVWNMATYDLREAMNASSEEFEHGIDEFAAAGLSKTPSTLVTPPRVAESPVQFECALLDSIEIPGNGPMGTVDVIFGRVFAVHIADWALTPDGKLDVLGIKPLARLGYYDYTYINHVFSMPTPMTAAGSAGLEGSATKAAAGLEQSSLTRAQSSGEFSAQKERS